MGLRHFHVVIKDDRGAGKTRSRGALCLNQEAVLAEVNIERESGRNAHMEVCDADCFGKSMPQQAR